MPLLACFFLFHISLLFVVADVLDTSRINRAGENLPVDEQMGDGYFGQWIYPDNYGGVSYNYTCDQTVDPNAFNTDLFTYYRLENDQNFVTGNYRLVGHASIFGYTQVRVDDNEPEWLSEATGLYTGSISSRQYGLGWGYLFDKSANETILSTFYEGSNVTDTFEREFGFGYSRKSVFKDNIKVTQIVTTPFGDDPVIISTIEITNNNNLPRNLAWIENFGGSMGLLDRLSGWDYAPKGKTIFEDSRAFASVHYPSIFSNISIGGTYQYVGIGQSRVFIPLNASEEIEYAQLIANMTAKGNPPMAFPPPGSEIWTSKPPSTYVVDISPIVGGADDKVAFGTDCSSFYGQGGRIRPDMLRMPLNLPFVEEGSLTPNNVGCVLAGKESTLAPGASIKYSYLWAYDSSGTGSTLSTYVDKYAPMVEAGSLEQTTVSSWLNVSYKFNGSSVAPWAERETLWNSYMLLSAASFDNGFGERMLDQGTAYRYVNAEMAAARDPAQHLLPAIFTSPWLAKSVLRFLLKMVQKNPTNYNGSSVIGGYSFNLPYSTINSYQIEYVDLRPSDQEMYLLYAAAEYILATRDFAFLNEEIPLYGDRFTTNNNVTVADALLSSLYFSIQNVSVGSHGLMRSLTSDWSDCLCTSLQPGCSGPNSTVWKRFFAEGESVLNSAMATFVFPHFADALQSADPVKFANAIQDSRAFAASQVVALDSSAWNTNHTWLRRAFLSNESGWFGENELVGVQHSWAILSNALIRNDTSGIIDEINTRLRSIGSIGMPLLVPPLNVSGPGQGENGGIWPSLNMPIIWAIGTYNLSLAWDEWSRNSLYSNANAYPKYWAAIWSSSDSLNSELSPDPFLHGRNGGWTTTWPTQCTHRHAWPLYTLLKLSGVSFTTTGIKLTPGLFVLNNESVESLVGENDKIWSLDTPLVSIKRTGRSSWSGHWDLSTQIGNQRSQSTTIEAILPISIDAFEESGTCEWTMRSQASGPLHFLHSIIPFRHLYDQEKVRIAPDGLNTSSLRMLDVREKFTFSSTIISWELTC
jgi:hypothetical protein